MACRIWLARTGMVILYKNSSLCFCSVASDPALVPKLNLYQPGEYHWLLPDDSLRTCFTQLAYHQRLFLWLGLTGSWQLETNLRVP